MSGPSPYTGDRLGTIASRDPGTTVRPYEKPPAAPVGGIGKSMGHVEGGVPQNKIPASEASRQDALCRGGSRGY